MYRSCSQGLSFQREEKCTEIKISSRTGKNQMFEGFRKKRSFSVGADDVHGEGTIWDLMVCSTWI